ncbi:MAG: acyl-CoA thioesterase [Nitrospinota bacterium]
MAHVMRTRVRWADTDQAGIAHFPKYFDWFVQAEMELFRESGKTRKRMNADFGVDEPRLSITCDFFSPAFEDDMIEIRTAVLNISKKSYHLRCEVHRVEDGVHLATGEMIACCVQPQEDGRIRSHPLPDEMLAALKRYLVSPEGGGSSQGQDTP